MSFRRKPESSYFQTFWTPAFAGVTGYLTFYEFIRFILPQILKAGKRGEGAEVTLQSRVARNKFCCGLGVWAVRAGSIGRDGQRLGESTEPPPKDAGGLGPRPLHEEITALWFQADRPNPQAGASLGL